MADGAGSEDGAGGVGRAGSGDGMGGSGSRARADGVPVLDQDQDVLAGDIMKALNEGNLEKAAIAISDRGKRSFLTSDKDVQYGKNRWREICQE